MVKLENFLTASQLNHIFNIIIDCDKADLNLGITLDDIEVRYVTDCKIFTKAISEFYLIVCHKSQSYFVGYDDSLKEWDCYTFIRSYSGSEIIDYLNSK